MVLENNLQVRQKRRRFHGGSLSALAAVKFINIDKGGRRPPPMWVATGGVAALSDLGRTRMLPAFSEFPGGSNEAAGAARAPLRRAVEPWSPSTWREDNPSGMSKLSTQASLFAPTRVV
ncbi:unnamed protein product, partial [Iphiclides podalirius]